MIKYDDNVALLAGLLDVFPINKKEGIIQDALDQYDGYIVYNYFNGKTWYYLAKNLDFTLSNEALEKGCIYLSRNDIKYYFPLYIYASIVNKDGWAFEYSFIFNSLTPGVMNEDELFKFIESFTELQKQAIYDFILYKYKVMNDVVAMDAFNDFWILYS